MTKRPQSKGTCLFCNKSFTRAGMTKHLMACPERKKAHDRVKRKAPAQNHYHLTLVEERRPDYWLHIEMKGAASLEDLDTYLRCIWLECCGHMSQFFEGGFWKTDVAISATLNKIVKPGDSLFHVYDFGFESRTIVTAVDVREEKPPDETPHRSDGPQRPGRIRMHELQPTRAPALPGVYDRG